jgi:hypothetical protein
MQGQEVIWIMIYVCLVMLGLTMYPRYRRRKRGRAGGSVSQLVVVVTAGASVCVDCDVNGGGWGACMHADAGGDVDDDIFGDAATDYAPALPQKKVGAGRCGH